MLASPVRVETGQTGQYFPTAKRFNPTAQSLPERVEGGALWVSYQGPGAFTLKALHTGGTLPFLRVTPSA